ncbi:MAG: adenosylhomocysteinase [Candidatus Omnitrophica bacterium]|nr:adenosylhomocysteinase [Candidatus Omnitrophota bacterium]MBU2044421.1 adenosylhomocysteinase [Candidatus Omnitrophota bacterium]MBU2266245.1 adenosylhomocysteinase [Candidatus Omnitrophota bacterium]MBU2473739.1 adenosylhomocysteinase [Candidatus Omnitrophota bacterium]
MNYDIKDKNLAKIGKQRIEWAVQRMPVLEQIRQRFSREQPLKGLTVAACLHITTETAGLAITLKAAGARALFCASNPLSTQDDTAASLVLDYGIEVFAINAENTKVYYQHIDSVLAVKPQITLDDGADLVSTIHKRAAGSGKDFHLPWASTEETTTGVIRLKALEKEGRLLYPVIAVNDAYTKHLFDNRYGTGQSTLDGIIRSTNKLIAGTTVVICGYGWCGRGASQRARGMGAKVVICEVDHLKALEAVMDGFSVMPMKEAAKLGDIFITVTGDINVITTEHFRLMKDQAIISNSGHFDVEIDIKSLEKIAVKKREVKPLVREYTLKDKKRIYLLGEGRLVNLACAEGHPAEVMDLSFANQALSCEYIAKNKDKLKKKVYKVPDVIDLKVAELKLKSLGIKIDKLTLEQKAYLSAWQEGT